MNGRAACLFCDIRDKKIKAEIQALSSKNLQYISTTYLPEKIKNQDFLP